MPRPISRLSLFLTLLILLPALPLALLCRGHTPSRFAAANLPPWERRRHERVSKRDLALKGRTMRRKTIGG